MFPLFMGDFLQDGGASLLAKLVNIPIIAIVYDTQMTIFRWVYLNQQTYPLVI